MGEAKIASDRLVNRRWLPLNALRAFDSAGRHMSFTAGAQALSVTQSAISRHVGSLEDLIGKPLFDRGPAGLKLTPAGETLLPVVSKCLDRMERTINVIRDKDLQSRPLRVHMPPTLLYQNAIPFLRDFHREHPEVRIDVTTSNVTGAPRTDVDMAIVFDRPSVDDMIADLLWLVRVAPLCAPATAAAHRGKSLQGFLQDNELLHVTLEGEPRGLLWSSYAEQQRLAIATDAGLAFDTAFSAVRYAMDATGVALADVDMFAQDIAAGRLVMPYDRVSADGYGYYLKTNAEDLADPAIYLLREWIIRHFAAGRPGDSGAPQDRAAAAGRPA